MESRYIYAFTAIQIVAAIGLLWFFATHYLTQHQTGTGNAPAVTSVPQEKGPAPPE